MADTTTATSSTVIGYFESHAEAENAVTALKEAGFQPNQVGIAASSASQPGSAASSAYDSDPTYDANRTTDPSSTYDANRTYDSTLGDSSAGTTRQKVGHKAEGVWEKVKNFFEGGDDVEPYADERQRGDLASREVTPGSYEYNHDDFRGSLQGLSVPDEHSRYFSHRVGQSNEGAVVTVTAPGRQEEAAQILEEHGADLGHEAANYEYPAATTETATDAPANRDQQHIQLFGEVLRVHKDRVNRGEVRVRKEVITENQTIQVPVTREELVVERVPVAGEQAAGPGAFSGEQKEIRIPLTQETASVDKQAVVREEVRLGKREVSNVESRDEQVRREELVVEDETSQMSNKR